MEFLNLLSHLLPDFPALAESSPQGLATIFWSLMVLVFGVALYFVGLHFIRFKRRVTSLWGLIKDQDKKALSANRREVLNNAEQLKDDEVGKLWR